MEDKQIVDLYWQRSERAIEETQKKYEKYCHCIANNILHSDEDSEECVLDTYKRAWKSIPPNRPERLGAYLGKITRNLALDRYKANHAQKRGSDKTILVFEELEEILTEKGYEESSFADTLALKEAINGFLRTLDKEKRIVFIQRYYYFLSVNEIAERNNLSLSNVKVILKRARDKLQKYLRKEGFDI